MGAGSSGQCLRDSSSLPPCLCRGTESSSRTKIGDNEGLGPAVGSWEGRSANIQEQVGDLALKDAAKQEHTPKGAAMEPLPLLPSCEMCGAHPSVLPVFFPLEFEWKTEERAHATAPAPGTLLLRRDRQRWHQDRRTGTPEQ